MAYEVMHMTKIKSAAALVGLMRHDTRDRAPSNADPEREKNNVYSATTDEAIAKYRKLLPEKVRKNAVHAISTVISASPDWFESATEKQKKEFIDRSQKWLWKVFGGKNELLMVLHDDEKTPHIHAIFMPLVDGKMNAKALLGGSKYRMRELQDDFHENVGKHLGMERGVPNKGIHHTEPKEFARIMREKEAVLSDREERVARAELALKAEDPLAFGKEKVYQVLGGLDDARKNKFWDMAKPIGDRLREEQKAEQAQKAVQHQPKNTLGRK